jgi:hypothetical protein
MGEKIYCFSANRICHHDDYFLVISCLKNAVNIKKKFQKIRVLFSKKKIIYLDIDSTDLQFFVFIILRSFWGGRGLGLSVRTEYLLESRTLRDFLYMRGRLVYFKSLLKRLLFFSIKNFSKTQIISIHKQHSEREKMAPYVSQFINDPQLWDLNILKVEPRLPTEFPTFSLGEERRSLLVAGRFNEQRSRKELLEFLPRNKKFNIIFAGLIEDEDLLEINNNSHCFVINRFVDNQELISLFENCDVVYCFYNNDRPSGFFGRAVQMSKPVLVRKDSFLESAFSSYYKLIAVESLHELNNYCHGTVSSKAGKLNFDDSQTLIEIIERL